MSGRPTAGYEGVSLLKYAAVTAIGLFLASVAYADPGETTLAQVRRSGAAIVISPPNITVSVPSVHEKFDLEKVRVACYVTLPEQNRVFVTEKEYALVLKDTGNQETKNWITYSWHTWIASEARLAEAKTRCREYFPSYPD